MILLVTRAIEESETAATSYVAFSFGIESTGGGHRGGISSEGTAETKTTH
jgi:hypothetical protein